ncbi:gliding motility-associated C-terminal domain-containing protein, partial [Gillisia sp. M10.2A]
TPNPNFNGIDTFNYTIEDGNGGTDTATVTITVNPINDTPPAQPTISITQPTCENPTGTITVETVTGLLYSINGVNYQESGVFTNLEPGTYSVTAQTTDGITSEITLAILNQPAAVEIETDSVDLCLTDDPYNLDELLLGEYDTSGIWEDPDNTGALFGNMIDPSKLSLGNYTFNYIVGGNCPSITSVTIEIINCIVLPCSIDEIKDSVSKVVTPNGDFINDYFEVDIDSECGFTFNLQIFNRWGAMVYETKNYKNKWDGFSNRSVTSSNQLPSGTYYYILEVNEGNIEPIQGYIYLGTK